MQQKSVLIAGTAAGLVAGAVATAAQVALWALAGDDVWRLLVEDTARAARILLGISVVHAPWWAILYAASLVHVAVSVGYGVLFATAAARYPDVLGPATGAIYGALVYAVDLHAFAVIWPWFEGSRGTSAMGAHLAFGVTLAITLRWCRGMRTVGTRHRSQARNSG